MGMATSVLTRIEIASFVAQGSHVMIVTVQYRTQPTTTETCTLKTLALELMQTVLRAVLDTPSGCTDLSNVKIRCGAVGNGKGQALIGCMIGGSLAWMALWLYLIYRGKRQLLGLPYAEHKVANLFLRLQVWLQPATLSLHAVQRRAQGRQSIFSPPRVAPTSNALFACCPAPSTRSPMHFFASMCGSNQQCPLYMLSSAEHKVTNLFLRLHVWLQSAMPSLRAVQRRAQGRQCISLPPGVAPISNALFAC